MERFVHKLRTLIPHKEARVSRIGSEYDGQPSAHLVELVNVLLNEQKKWIKYERTETATKGVNTNF